MASQGILGMWGGIGQGLAMVGEQGMRDRSEQARMKLSHALELERDELQAGRAADAAEKDRAFRSAEAEKATKAALEASKGKIAFEREKLDREDARAREGNKAKVEAARLRGSGGGNSDKLDPNTKGMLDALSQQYSGLMNQERAYSDMMANGGELTPEQTLQWKAIQDQKTTNMAERQRLLKWTPEAPPEPTDDQFRAALSKVNPEDREEFIAEARAKYGDEKANRLAGLFPAAEKPAPTNILGQPSAPKAEPKPVEKPAPVETPEPGKRSAESQARVLGVVREKLAEVKAKADVAGTRYTKQVGRGGYSSAVHPDVDVEAEIQRISKGSKIPLETVRAMFDELGKK